MFSLGFINSLSSAESSGCAKVEFYPSLLPSAHVGGAGGDFLADKVGLCRPRWVCAAPGGFVPPQVGLCRPGSVKCRICVPAGPVRLSRSSAQLSWD